MSLGLLLTPLIIAALALLLAVVTLNTSGTGAPTLFIPATPAPALDERDLLDTDPREWVRQAEQAVEFEEGDKMGHMDSFMRMQRDIEHPRGPAPRFTCVICGVHDTGHTHSLKETK